jgi:antitoxin (DNA-binding transcriptional repressor) of toxin-antitoxin stability system
MAATTIDIHDLPTRLAEVVALAAAGSEAIVTENRVPVARLVPFQTGPARIPGLHAGAITTAEDFDAPLPEEFWTGPP